MVDIERIKKPLIGAIATLAAIGVIYYGIARDTRFKNLSPKDKAYIALINKSAETISKVNGLSKSAIDLCKKGNLDNGQDRIETAFELLSKIDKEALETSRLKDLQKTALNQIKEADSCLVDELKKKIKNSKERGTYEEPIKEKPKSKKGKFKAFKH